jgi:hypothetical protein
LQVIEGMGRAIHTNLYTPFKCDTLKLAMIKTERLAVKLFAGSLYDCMCSFQKAPAATAAAAADERNAALLPPSAAGGGGSGASGSGSSVGRGTAQLGTAAAAAHALRSRVSIP